MVAARQSRLGRATCRSAIVRNAPKATAGSQNVARREGPKGDMLSNVPRVPWHPCLIHQCTEKRAALLGDPVFGKQLLSIEQPRGSFRPHRPPEEVALGLLDSDASERI